MCFLSDSVPSEDSVHWTSSRIWSTAANPHCLVQFNRSPYTFSFYMDIVTVYVEMLTTWTLSSCSTYMATLMWQGLHGHQGGVIWHFLSYFWKRALCCRSGTILWVQFQKVGEFCCVCAHQSLNFQQITWNLKMDIFSEKMQIPSF